jgi:hypothetical protein
MVAVPAVGSTRSSSIRSVVVFPAPFGPRNPVTRPGSTVNDKSSTALTPRYSFLSPQTSIRPREISAGETRFPPSGRSGKPGPSPPVRVPPRQQHQAADDGDREQDNHLTPPVATAFAASWGPGWVAVAGE